MQIKLKAGKLWKKANFTVQEFNGEERGFLTFSYNPTLLDFARSLGDSKWSPDYKAWHCDLGPRSMFRLDHAIQGRDNPYLRWRFTEEDWPEIEMDRPYMPHQVVAIRKALVCRRMLWSQEMRTGKTLQAIKVLEMIGGDRPWWVSNKAGLAGVMVDFEKWNVKLPVQFMTYERLVKVMDNWPGGKGPTDLIIDEVHKVKNPGAQRTHAVSELVRGMLEDHKDPVVIAMSGTCAPKDPVDWWSPIEILAPGYLQESNTKSFRRRLSLVVDGESQTGGWFPEHITWFDDPKKCKTCGGAKGLAIHQSIPPEKKNPHLSPHKFVSSKDELGTLKNRLKGIVHVQHKKDCLDLPELLDNYWYYNNGWKVTNDLMAVDINPSDRIKKLRTGVRNLAPQAAVKMIRTRELSDGFQYKYVMSDKVEECPECKGEGSCLQYDEFEEQVFEECWKCNGEGKCPIEIRTGVRIDTPKDELLKQHLEEFETTSRNVVFTAFTESTDRVVDICTSQGWNVIRVDGRGWQYFGEYTFTSPVEALKAYANKDDFERIVFVGHPRSGGTGISLSASSCIIFYSNVEAADDKMQARARIHDLGMDTARGAVIQEYFHLEEDVECIYRYFKKVGLQYKVTGDSHVKKQIISGKAKS